MPAATRFEDLRMWQQARRLANLTYKLTGQSGFADSDLRSQMRRAAVSAMSNIAEGFGRGANEEFLYFLYIAKGSAAELRSQFYLSHDLDYISDVQFREAKRQCEDATKLIQAFARSLKGAGKPGFRHRRKPVPWSERVQQVMKKITEASQKE